MMPTWLIPTRGPLIIGALLLFAGWTGAAFLAGRRSVQPGPAPKLPAGHVLVEAPESARPLPGGVLLERRGAPAGLEAKTKALRPEATALRAADLVATPATTGPVHLALTEWKEKDGTHRLSVTSPDAEVMGLDYAFPETPATPATTRPWTIQALGTKDPVTGRWAAGGQITRTWGRLAVSVGMLGGSNRQVFVGAGIQF